MKNFYFMLLSLLLMTTSCSKSVNFDDVTDNLTKNVTFSCDGDFELDSISPYTRAINIYASDIWAFDYVNGELVQEIHQTRGDVNFGRPSIDLSYGNHRIYFVVSNGFNPTVNHSNYTIKWQSPGDSFQATYDINVTNNTQSTASINLKRVAAKLVIRIKNGLPHSSYTMKMTSTKWYDTMNYTSGRGVQEKSFTYRTNITENSWDNTVDYTYYTLIDDNFYTQVRIDALDYNEVPMVGTYINSVKIERGKCTTFSGTLETDIATGMANNYFNLNTPSSWDNGYNGTW